MNPNSLPWSPAPWVRRRLTTGGVMTDVILALLPAVFYAVGRFGTHALLLLLAAVAAAVTLECAANALLGRSASLRDGSAALTGLLLGLTLPPNATVFHAWLGGALAVLAGKALWGGLGRNRLNPALTGRCLLCVFFGTAMTAYGKENGLGALTAAANRGLVLTGSLGGVLGGSVIALLLGGLWLLWRGRIRWQTPVAVLAGFLVFTVLFGGEGTVGGRYLWFLSGGGMLAAFFLAADPVTSPATERGRWICGGLIGLFSALLLRLLPAPEAVCLAVLLGNLAAPIIEKHTIPKPRT